MQEEKDICCSPEYSPQSVLLLLHDHFAKRMHELASCRYEHLLRWRRFREHLGVLENLQPYFSSRMEMLLKHYEDYSSRTQRLASVRESFFYKSDNAMEDVNPDDIVLYIRWLVAHLQSVRLYSQFLRVIQWTPYAHRHDVSKDLPDYLTQPNPDGPLEEDGAAAHPATSSVVRVVQAAPADHALREVPTPPPMIAPSVTAHNPVSQSQFTLALAAAATQTVWNSSLLSLPLHTSEIEDLKPHLLAYCEIYGIGANAETLQCASDEMELFACVNRKFRQLFFQQEVQRTFRTYDHRETDVEKWGLDTPNHALRKPANWLKYAKLQPEKNLAAEQTMTELRRRKQVDELLRSACRFVGVSDPERVQDVLRNHASSVANPPHLHGTAVATYASGKKTIETWRKIYSNPQIYDESVSFQSSSETRKKKRRDSFDFNQTMQMLGLNDADSMKDDPAGVQGAYLSYLHLRHLKTRDLRRTCLSYLNYFRSLERTVTINDQGIFEEGGSVERSPLDQRVGNESEGYQGGTNPLGCHDYMYSTPKDHKYEETDFMRFQDVENYDDFYTHEEGRVHVRDHRGYYVVYDQAMDDLKNLEEDLLLVASYYIQKDRDAMEKLATRRASKSTGGGGGDEEGGDFAIGKYGHAAVDRFAVAMDMWNQEAQFMQSKKALLDLYMEAYHNTFDRDEKRHLSQAVISLIYRRPRYDFSAAYFLTTYRLECTSLRLHASLVQKFMERQISQQRDYVNRLNRDSGSQGLPLDFVAKQLVSIHTDQAASKSQYLLEFHPSLSVVSRLPKAFQHALTELVNLHQAKTSNEEIQLERSMFEVLHKEWDGLDQLGASYTQQTKNNLFSGVFMDDPQAVASLAKSAMAEADKANARSDKKLRKKRLLESAGQVLELVTQRHRLCELAWESEILAKIYKAISVDTGFGEYHAFIRYIQLESARRVEGAETAKAPASIVQVLEDDSAVDKFQPSHYLLAIQEIDEGHLGRFSFRSKDSIQALLTSSGIQNLQVVLKLQTVHRNALSSAVLLAHNCRFDPGDVGQGGQGALKSGRMSPSDTRSERSTITAMTGFSIGGGSGAASAAAATAAATAASFRAFEKQRSTGHFDPESFFSVQLEKTPSRNRMINSFAAKKEGSTMLLKSQSELEKLKRELISQLSDDFNQRVSQASMRAQIIGYYNSIRDCLAQMPAIASAYFMLGEKNEAKPEEEPESVVADPRTLKKRPRQLLSESGDELLNLWFVPHYSDLLKMFRGLDDKRATKALENAVKIVGSFHDILQYLIGYSQLGTSGSRSGAARAEEPQRQTLTGAAVRA
ncbi:hypothetical protein BOX15_Mlig033119g1 [Macrostomum lignano]|uniref:DUF4549 domain-containing protein n=1 Tax=Macrostomum lignano TaxID=282301 RepID=A0A267F7Y2_9PLAT|nr:hypothetical protein BOX15_Mlig033119g1 [Macrostomum lignano]